MHGHLSVKADVYSYGVLVLELVTGHRNSSSDPAFHGDNLLNWVSLYYCLIFDVLFQYILVSVESNNIRKVIWSDCLKHVVMSSIFDLYM